jgi:hypothetical protein
MENPFVILPPSSPSTGEEMKERVKANPDLRRFFSRYCLFNKENGGQL